MPVLKCIIYAVLHSYLHHPILIVISFLVLKLVDYMLKEHRFNFSTNLKKIENESICNVYLCLVKM